MSRTTVFTSTHSSQFLSPYTPRPPPSPPGGHSVPVVRSSSLSSNERPSSRDGEVLATSSAIRHTFETSYLKKQGPMGYSNRPCSLKPRPLPSPLHPRRRSWFREEDPSAFGPTSPDPAALSPMATFRSSMSEDEQRDELFSEASLTPSSTSSLSPCSPYTKSFNVQTEYENEPVDDQEAFRPFSIVGEGAFLALPSRSRSDSIYSNYSNPAVIINTASDDPEIPRRASDGERDRKNLLYYNSGFERSSSLASGTRLQQKRSVWERTPSSEDFFGTSHNTALRRR